METDEYSSLRIQIILMSIMPELSTGQITVLAVEHQLPLRLPSVRKSESIEICESANWPN